MQTPHVGEITVVALDPSTPPDRIFDDIPYIPAISPPPTAADRENFAQYRQILEGTVKLYVDRKISLLEYTTERELAQFCHRHRSFSVARMTSTQALEQAIHTERNPFISEDWLKLAGLLEKRESYTYRAW